MAFLVLFAGAGVADDPPEPALAQDLLALVRTLGNGQVEYSREDRRIVIAHDAMTYQIHTPDRLGRMQRAHAELGPNRDGVVVEIQLLDGPYGGPMELPAWRRGPYYDTYCTERKEGDRFLYVKARFGGCFPADLRRRVLDRLGATLRARPPVPVRLLARPRQARFGTGEPLGMTVTLRNGLRRPARLTTHGVFLVAVARDGERLAAPTGTVSPPALSEIAARDTVTVRLDLREWKIDGGWIPGAYDVTVCMSGIEVDESVRLSVRSDPVRFAVE